MPKEIKDFLMESGVNRRGNISIELSPVAYDMLINELRQIKEMLVNTIVIEKHQEMEVSEMVEIISNEFPASMLLSFHPICSEFFNSKNNKVSC